MHRKDRIFIILIIIWFGQPKTYYLPIVIKLCPPEGNRMRGKSFRLSILNLHCELQG